MLLSVWIWRLPTDTFKALYAAPQSAVSEPCFVFCSWWERWDHELECGQWCKIKNAEQRESSVLGGHSRSLSSSVDSLFPVYFACRSQTHLSFQILSFPACTLPWSPPVHVLLIPHSASWYALIRFQIQTTAFQPVSSLFSACSVMDPCLPSWIICLWKLVACFDCSPVADACLTIQARTLHLPSVSHAFGSKPCLTSVAEM